MNDTSKLPKWAQQRIEKLEGDVAYWRRKVTEAVSGDTDTFIDEFPELVGLPRGSRIVFCLPDLSQIETRVQDKSLYVAARGGGGPLEIQPEVSNVVRIKVGRRP